MPTQSVPSVFRSHANSRELQKLSDFVSELTNWLSSSMPCQV